MIYKEFSIQYECFIGNPIYSYLHNLRRCLWITPYVVAPRGPCLHSRAVCDNNLSRDKFLSKRKPLSILLTWMKEPKNWSCQQFTYSVRWERYINWDKFSFILCEHDFTKRFQVGKKSLLEVGKKGIPVGSSYSGIEKYCISFFSLITFMPGVHHPDFEFGGQLG